MRFTVRLVTAGLVLLITLPAVASAQSGIAGLVKDASGAVLPGVTVEAGSPALIEKVRTVVTDDQGRYSIVDLRPGTYSVTFTLPGFNPVKRDGIVLPAAFTATVSVEMAVGGVQETVTVTGEAPLVDVQRTALGQVFSQEGLQSIPTTARMVQRYTTLIPGVMSNQGGIARGLGTESGQLAIHGGRDGEGNISLEGVSTRNMNGPGGLFAARYIVNPGMIQEVAVSLGSQGADQQMGAVVTNAIPKSGGNTFSGFLFGHWANESFSSSNLNHELEVLGLGAAGALRETWDFNPGGGGPLKRDRLWFYASYRHWGNEFDSGVRYNLTPAGWSYTPDLNRPTASQRLSDQNYSFRLTGQITPRNTATLFVDSNPRTWSNRSVSPTVSVESSTWTTYRPNYVVQSTWKSPVSSRLFLEANGLYQKSNNLLDPSIDPEIFTGSQPAAPGTLIGATELNTNMRIRSGSTNYGNLGQAKNFRSAASASYVTGSQTLKLGMEFLNGQRYENQYRVGDISYNLRNGSPNQVVLYAPRDNVDKLKADLGIYVQERLTFQRTTVNAGLRYDYLNSYAAAHTVPGNRWLPERSYDAVKDVPAWHDLSPRLGVSYDLFGDGRTAIKATLNRYVVGEAVRIATENNPVVTSVQSATRTWTDVNRDFVPDCDFSNLDANGECGSISDRNFGQGNPRATVWDQDMLRGFGNRDYQWESSLQVQHQLLSRVSVQGGYFRRTFGNYRTTKNLALGADPSIHYDPFCVTLPVDSRLPGDGGNQVCGLYDIKPAMRGVVQNYVTTQSTFGEQKEVYDGFDATVNVRMPRGLLAGGLNTGRTRNNVCLVVNSPQELLFCDQRPPFLTQVKFTGAYELPWYGIQLAGTYQGLPGPEIVTSYVATNAEVISTLGRSLSAGATATVTIPVAAAGTMYAERSNQIDLRISKIIRIGRSRLLGGLDVFNVFNSAGVLAVNSRYGPQYLNPTSLLSPRLLRLSVQLDF